MWITRLLPFDNCINVVIKICRRSDLLSQLEDGLCGAFRLFVVVLDLDVDDVHGPIQLRPAAQ